MPSSTDENSSIGHGVIRNNKRSNHYVQTTNVLILAGLISVFWSIIVVHNVIVLNMAQASRLEDQVVIIMIDEPETIKSTKSVLQSPRRSSAQLDTNTNTNSLYVVPSDDSTRVQLMPSTSGSRPSKTIAQKAVIAASEKQPPGDGNDNSAITSIASRQTAIKVTSNHEDNESSASSTFKIVHIVTTRFQMKQAHAPLLARARFRLFETFCLPTMRHQTNQNFIWIILTDPALDEELLEWMRQSLQNNNNNNNNGNMPHSNNAYLTLTNDDAFLNNNHGIDPMRYRELLLDKKIKVVTGDMERLDEMLGSLATTTRRRNTTTTASSFLLVLDTLLDADDGFHHGTIDELQNDAATHASQLLTMQQRQEQQQLRNAALATTVQTTTTPTQSLLSLSNAWWVSAVSSHFEWHNRDVYLGSRGVLDSSQIGHGILGRRDDATKMAISAGLTRTGILERVGETTMTTTASNASTNKRRNPSWFPDAALKRHDRIGALPRCVLSEDTSTTTTDFEASALLLTRCQKRVLGNFTSVIKARTVTSNSMDDVTYVHNISDYGVHPSRKDFENELEVYSNQTAIWEQVRREFGVESETALATSRFLFDHAALIAQEQLNATCVEGWHAPCGRNRLQNMKHIYKLTRNRLKKKKN